jgi:serine/threonine protein phosphatase PrpC
MLGQFNIGYTVRRVPAAVRAAGLLAALLILCWLSDGFPPHPWLFLFQALGQMPRLWALRGPGVLLPLGALVLLALMLALAWLLLLLAGWRLGRSIWEYWREQRRFQHELQEAEYLAAREVRQWEHAPAGSQPLSAPTPGAQRPGGRRRPTADLAAATPTRAGRSAWADFPTRVDLASAPLDFASVESDEQLDFPSDGVDGADETPRPWAGRTALLQHSLVPLAFAMGSASDPGIKRKHRPNEDALSLMRQKRARTEQTFGLFLVADGMGGHSNGREASHLVVETFVEIALPALINSVESDEAFLTDLLTDAIQHANLKLYQRNRAEKADMGTTLTGALLIDDMVYVFNVGDSRTYLYRPATGLTRITTDHSVVARLLDEGSITPDEIYSHPRRNQIYRCLGEKAAVEVDIFAVSVLKGDKLLLCSDGLWEMVRDPQIERMLGLQADPAAVSQYLLQAALDNGGDDNVSLIVVEVLQTPS